MTFLDTGGLSETRECAFCRRHVPKSLITLHHLLPKQRGGKAEDRVPLCKPCHKQIHATFTNRELERHFADLNRLRSAEALQPFVSWIVRQKPDRNFRVKTSKSKSRR